MGGRLLRQWLRTPLRDLEHIVARQNAVAAFLESPAALKTVIGKLDNVCDIERIVGRLAVGRASPRDLSALGKCLLSLPKLLEQLNQLTHAAEVTPELVSLGPFCTQQANYLTGAVMAEPAAHLREGGVIADRFDPELDRLREIGTNSQQWLAGYQAQLAAESGINAVRIGFNKVFGYYIEVTDSHRDKVPAAWTRKQTIKNAERYITEELKKFEDEALGAQDKAIALEQRSSSRSAKLCCRTSPVSGTGPRAGSGRCAGVARGAGGRTSLLPADDRDRARAAKSSTAGIPCSSSSSAASSSPTIRSSPPKIR